jgi:hypothetical protein
MIYIVIFQAYHYFTALQREAACTLHLLERLLNLKLNFQSIQPFTYPKITKCPTGFRSSRLKSNRLFFNFQFQVLISLRKIFQWTPGRNGSTAKLKLRSASWIIHIFMPYNDVLRHHLIHKSSGIINHHTNILTRVLPRVPVITWSTVTVYLVHLAYHNGKFCDCCDRDPLHKTQHGLGP